MFARGKDKLSHTVWVVVNAAYMHSFASEKNAHQSNRATIVK